MLKTNPKTRRERLVIAGGCAAGMSAASKAKRMNPELEILAFEKTPHVSYSACGIPYYVSDLVREASELVTISPEAFRRERDIEVFTRHSVVDIQPVQRRITVVDLQANSERVYDYDRLVIAVGGTPFRPEVPGADLHNIWTIQTLQDGIRIKEFIDRRRPQRVVIFGGGYIGMEMAEACRRRGLKVTVVERSHKILRTYEQPISEYVMAELSAHQVKVITNAQVERFERNARGEVVSVLLHGSNATLPADFVLICAGLKANTDLARSANVRIGNTGAIAVDWKMQTNVPNIFAAGDCIEVKNLVTGKPDYFPLGPAANKQGRVAGENIGGGTATFRGVVGTSVFKVFNLEVARTGLCVGRAREHAPEVDSVTITEKEKAGYFPSASDVAVCVVFDKRSRRLLGAQMVGKSGVSKRIDVFAAALWNKLTLDDMMHLDLSYAPPFAPVWDPVLVTVNVARGKCNK